MKYKSIIITILLVTAFFFAACTDNTRDLFLETPVQTPTYTFDPVNLPSLHVDGRYLKNEAGEIVNLHGFAQTYSPFFNNDSWSNYDVDACLSYNQKCFDGILAAGWKVNFVRQHMDPYWCCGTYSGEDVAYKTFNVDKFMKYLNLVFIPMAEYAIERGVYVLMRPPGVCPETIAAGDAYNKYLVQVWDSVSSHPKIKNNPGIMFELANEPVNIEGTDGSIGGTTNPQFEAMRNFLQPIVDVIRNNGANNIVWLPGLGYQSWFCGFPNYPVQGENLGYAVHCYPGWYGSDAEQDSGEGIGTPTGGGYATFQAGWDKQVGPVVSTAPLIVTEMDWAAVSYNATWGKGVTGETGGSGFGANFKYITDNCGNVSWLIFTGQEYLMKFVDEAGEPGNYTMLNDPEACLWPVYHWYQEYASTDDDKNSVVRTLTAKIDGVKYEDGSNLTLLTGGAEYLLVFATYSDGTIGVLPTSSYEVSSSNTRVVKVQDGSLVGMADGDADITVSYTENNETKSITIHVNATSFSLDAIDATTIWGVGSYNTTTHTLITGENGFGGWHYTNGLDLSECNYLVVELCKGTNVAGNVSFRMYDENNYWSTAACFTVKDYRLIINLKNQVVNEGETVDPSHLYYIGFWTVGGEKNKVVINRIYPTNTYPTDEYEVPETPGGGGNTGGDTDDDVVEDYVFPISGWETLFIADTGTSFDTSTGEIITGKYGAVGWNGNWNLSDYHYLIVELDEKSQYVGDEYSFRLFDKGYWNNCARFILADKVKDYKLKIDLTETHKVTNDQNEILRTLDVSTINVIAFWSTGSNPIYVKKVYVTNKEE